MMEEIKVPASDIGDSVVTRIKVKSTDWEYRTQEKAGEIKVLKLKLLEERLVRKLS